MCLPLFSWWGPRCTLSFHFNHISSVLHIESPFLLMAMDQGKVIYRKQPPTVPPSCSQIPSHQCTFLFVNGWKADCKPLESVLFVSLNSTWQPAINFSLMILCHYSQKLWRQLRSIMRYSNFSKPCFWMRHGFLSEVFYQLWILSVKLCVSFDVKS